MLESLGYKALKDEYLDMSLDMSEVGCVFDRNAYVNHRSIKGCRIGECGNSSFGHFVHGQ